MWQEDDVLMWGEALVWCVARYWATLSVDSCNWCN